MLIYVFSIKFYRCFSASALEQLFLPSPKLHPPNYNVLPDGKQGINFPRNPYMTIMS